MNLVPPITRQFMRGWAEPNSSVVILQPEVSDQILTAHPPKSILQLHELDKNVVLGIEAGRSHGSLEIERQPFLDAAHSAALRKVHEQNQIEDKRRREDRIAAQKVDLDLHRVAQPSENVDVVPA